MHVGRKMFSYKAGRIDLRCAFEDGDVSRKDHPNAWLSASKNGPQA
jgi:hypothetical protein